MSSNSEKVLMNEQAAEIELSAEDRILRTAIIQLLRRTSNEEGETVLSYEYLPATAHRPAMMAIALQLTPAIGVEMVSQIVAVEYRDGKEVVETEEIFGGAFVIGFPKPTEREVFRQSVSRDALGHPEVISALHQKIRVYNRGDWEEYPYSVKEGEPVCYHIVNPNETTFDGEVRVPFGALLTQTRSFSARQTPSRSGGGRYPRYAVSGASYTALDKTPGDEREAWGAMDLLIAITPTRDWTNRGKVLESRQFHSGDVKDGKILGDKPIRIIALGDAAVPEWDGDPLTEILHRVRKLLNKLMTVLCHGMKLNEKLTIEADAEMIEHLDRLGLYHEELAGFLTRRLADEETVRACERDLRKQAAKEAAMLLAHVQGATDRLAAKATETPKPAQDAATEATDGASDDASEPIGDLVEEGAEATDGGEEIVDEPERQPVQGAPANDDTAFEPVGDGDGDELVEEEDHPTSEDDSRPFVETPMPTAAANGQEFEPLDDSYLP